MSVSWSFTVAGYAVLPASMKVTADTTKAGFLWNIFANLANTENSIRRAELEMGGLLTATDGSLLPNMADPSAQGVAAAAASAPTAANGLVRFEIPTVINLSVTGGESNGNFTPDGQMPGLPSTEGSSDGVAAEVITFVELPVGIITMGVNGDDNFRTLAGIDAGSAILLGEYDVPGGRTAADTLFNFEVKEAGVYPLRTVYEQGTTSGNIQWFTVKSDGTKVLLNDSANGDRRPTAPLRAQSLLTSDWSILRQLHAS